MARIRLIRRGRVWRNLYFSCPLDPAHAAFALRCVEFNPVRAGMVEPVLDHEWSSARAHTGMAIDAKGSDVSAWGFDILPRDGGRRRG